MYTTSTVDTAIMQGRESRSKIILILSIACIFLSIYLINEHYAEGPSVCDTGSVFSCSTVNRSEYSELLGVPVAIFGAIWAVVLAFGAYKVNTNDRAAYFITAILLWTIMGVGFIFYMVLAEFIVGSICLFCTAIHILTLVIFYHAVKLYQGMNVTPDMNAFFYNMRWVMLTVVIICLVPVVLINNNNNAHPGSRKYAPHDSKITLSSSSTENLSSVSDKEYVFDSSLSLEENVAKCVTLHHGKMFGSDLCGVCQRQKKLLGTAFENIVYVECRTNSDKCKEFEIGGYPTWIKFDEDEHETKRNVGFLTTPDLAKYFNCPVA
eukprot:TRINITY_DN7078_c1_g1_i1.p1 TRINITY_DN7078_c1_g1~~TRINITY_DN7078_c1_g1_i1.p1  ORF type:complete len:322 (+),score=50.54 TRINITY_DN7078_c1_g1_i1:60-1025(+)